MNKKKLVSMLAGIALLLITNNIMAQENKTDINAVLKEKNIVLPELPKALGNYQHYARTGNLVYICEAAMKDGKAIFDGKLGAGLTEEQVKEATKITMLNVISALKEATGGDLNRVKRCVQLTGFITVTDEYASRLSPIMNVATDLTVEIFGEKGKHTRATLGISNLPITPIEIQAIFEIE